MGCFSFICKKCGEPINSDSFVGENVRLSLLENGKVIEEMQGQYDSYGRVFNENDESIEWGKTWDDVCDLMFDPDNSNGIAATHAACITPDYNPTERSDNDPDQGWGEIETQHQFKCEIYYRGIMGKKIC